DHEPLRGLEQRHAAPPCEAGPRRDRRGLVRETDSVCAVSFCECGRSQDSQRNRLIAQVAAPPIELEDLGGELGDPRELALAERRARAAMPEMVRLFLVPERSEPLDAAFVFKLGERVLIRHVVRPAAKAERPRILAGVEIVYGTDKESVQALT